MIHLLINPNAGKGRGADNGRIVEQALAQRSLCYVKHVTRRAGETTALAQKALDAGCTLLLTVGGDGTVGEASQALIGTETVLGIIPSGTGNDYVKTLGIEPDVGRAIDIALTGARQRVDAMRVNGRACLNIASIGLDASAAHYAARAKRLRGMGAYLYGLCFAFFLGKLPRFVYSIDGGAPVSAVCTLAAFANGQYYGGGFRPVPFASHTDGIMDVLMVDKLPRLRMLPLMASYAKGKHVDWDICRFYRCRRIFIRAAKDPLILNIDGETSVEETIDIELLPRAVCVAVPGGEDAPCTPD